MEAVPQDSSLIDVVSRMADSVTDYLQKHGISSSPRFSEDWACENWDNWSKIEEQLNLVTGKLKKW